MNKQSGKIYEYSLKTGVMSEHSECRLRSAAED
jgi:hypothetical protein